MSRNSQLNIILVQQLTDNMEFKKLNQMYVNKLFILIIQYGSYFYVILYFRYLKKINS